MSGAGQAGASAGSTQQGGGNGGTAGGSGGSGGVTPGGAGQGGSGGIAQNGGAGSGNGGSGGMDGPPAIEQCMGTPSLDHLSSWNATNEGVMVPASGSILVKDGAGYAGKVQFVGNGWHVVPVYVANQYGKTADLSASKGFWLTYSATAELHVQLRSKSHWDGGTQYATTIPSTSGAKVTTFFPFSADWKSVFNDQPVLSYADTLKEAMGMVFVGEFETTIVFYGLRFDGYTPMCP